MMLINVLCGALLGIICKPVSSKISAGLLSNRQKQYNEFKSESLFLYLLSAATGAAIMYVVPISAETLYLFLLLIISESIALIDIKFRIIPNELSLAIIGLTVVFGIPGLLGAKGFPNFNLKHSLLGFAVCLLIFLLPAVFSKQVGAGDIKLAAAMGFCLGFWNSLLGIILMGAFVIAYIFFQAKMPVLTVIKSMIPMGPFIAAAMVIISILIKLPSVSIYFTDLPF